MNRKMVNGACIAGMGAMVATASGFIGRTAEEFSLWFMAGFGALALLAVVLPMGFMNGK